MAMHVRPDQALKVQEFLETYVPQLDLVGLAIDRHVGKGQVRQLGETLDRDELDGLGSAEAIVGMLLDYRIRSLGKYTLRADFGVLEDGTRRTQPRCAFEVVSDVSAPRAAPDSQGAAVRDLAVQVTRSSDLLGTRLDTALDQVRASSSEVLQTVREMATNQLTAERESGGAMLELSVELATKNAEVKILENELRRHGSGFWAILAEHLPPEGWTALTLSSIQGIARLGSAAIAVLEAKAVQAGGQLPAPARTFTMPMPGQGQAAAAPPTLTDEQLIGLLASRPDLLERLRSTVPP